MTWMPQWVIAGTPTTAPNSAKKGGKLSNSGDGSNGGGGGKGGIGGYGGALKA